MTDGPRAIAGFGLVAVALLALPNLLSALDIPVFLLVFAYGACFWVTQATSWNILSGYGGYFSFGQGAFFGIGVYTAALLATRADVNFFVALPLAGLTAALLAGAVGFLAFRVRTLGGEIFALLTLAVAFVLAALARYSPSIDGGVGITVPQPSYPSWLGEYPEFVFRLGVVLALGAVATAYAIERSRLGWGLFAVRDDETVAEGLGVPTLRTKLVALGVSGAIAGLSGGVHAMQISYVTVEDVFSLRVPLLVILMCVLGGRRSWLGPVVGALFVFTLQERLSGAGLEDWSQIALGAVLLAAVLFVPEGLSDRLRARRVPAGVAFGGALAALTLTGTGGRPTDRLALAMGLTLVVLLLPGLGRRRSADDGGAQVEPGRAETTSQPPPVPEAVDR